MKIATASSVRNMPVVIVLLLFSLSTVISQNVDIFNPQVFNYYFYVNANSLQDSGITSEAAAKAHWQVYGIPEGWQAAGNFHSRQYLDRYPDLKQAFGTNYLLAINHYLTHGLTEGRLGYLEGGGYGRWTVSSGVNTGIFLSGSARSAGAVDRSADGNATARSLCPVMMIMIGHTYIWRLAATLGMVF
eukprot:TRINITY_DN3438_c0_g1_i3.p1 TRINITY_DN3438_c0_g1~~TRINITY_DN3438_c0_g1_i3.p1  ORF type:complete len:196 (-),score=12.72 TRINITY_DN3438_c0_g1_i3:247-810(-)